MDVSVRSLIQIRKAAQKTCDVFVVDVQRNSRGVEDRSEICRPNDAPLVCMVVEWAWTNYVARKAQSSFDGIPKCEGEVTDYSGEAIATPLQVTSHHNRHVGVSTPQFIAKQRNEFLAIVQSSIPTKDVAIS